MYDLTDKVALVTGGSRGLGRAIALAMARQGADVGVNYRGNAEAAAEVVTNIRSLGRAAIAIQGDTSAGREACESIVKAAIDEFGKVDILVNNAGITRDNLLMRMDADEWESVINTNLSGPFWMTRAIALALARQGADVGVNYRSNADSAAEVVSEIRAMGRAAITIQGDTSAGREACDAIVKAAIDEFGKVDILVNNAGITRDNLMMRMDEEDWESVLDTNLSGPFWMTRAIARPMLKARSGRIINMSSVAGRMGNVGQANYASAKAGLIGLTKSVARELASRGITCNAIAPGLIETELTADISEAARKFVIDSTPLGYIGSVEDVAAAAVYFASDESRYVTGQVLGVDGGMMMGS